MRLGTRTRCARFPSRSMLSFLTHHGSEHLSMPRADCRGCQWHRTTHAVDSGSVEMVGNHDPTRPPFAPFPASPPLFLASSLPPYSLSSLPLLSPSSPPLSLFLHSFLCFFHPSFLPVYAPVPHSSCLLIPPSFRSWVCFRPHLAFGRAHRSSARVFAPTQHSLFVAFGVVSTLLPRTYRLRNANLSVVEQPQAAVQLQVT